MTWPLEDDQKKSAVGSDSMVKATMRLCSCKDTMLGEALIWWHQGERNPAAVLNVLGHLSQFHMNIQSVLQPSEVFHVQLVVSGCKWKNALRRRSELLQRGP